MFIDPKSMISAAEENQRSTKEVEKEESFCQVIPKNSRPADAVFPCRDDELHFLPDPEILKIGCALLDIFSDDFLKMAE